MASLFFIENVVCLVSNERLTFKRLTSLLFFFLSFFPFFSHNLIEPCSQFFLFGTEKKQREREKENKFFFFCTFFLLASSPFQLDWPFRKSSRESWVNSSNSSGKKEQKKFSLGLTRNNVKKRLSSSSVSSSKLL